MQNVANIHWTRTDTDGASEVLRLVVLDGGEKFVSSDLEGAEYPYLVQITSGPDAGDDFVGLYDLDGDEIAFANRTWELASEAPVDVIEQIESGWGNNTSAVARVVVQS